MPPGKLIQSTKVLPLDAALYIYKSTMQPFMEHYCRAWAGASSCYLEMLDVRKSQKRICRIVGPSLAASLGSLDHRRNIASLSLFFRYYVS